MSFNALSTDCYLPGDYIVKGLAAAPDDIVQRAMMRLENPANPLPERYSELCEEVTFRAVRMYGEPGKYEEGEVAYLRGMGCAAVLATMMPTLQPLRFAAAPLHFPGGRDRRFFQLMAGAGRLYIERDEIQQVVDACAAELNPEGENMFLMTHGMATGLQMAELGRYRRMQQSAGQSLLRNTEKSIHSLYLEITNQQHRDRQRDAREMQEIFDDLTEELSYVLPTYDETLNNSEE